MKNKLTDLNNHLFAQLERLSDEELTQEMMMLEQDRTKCVIGISREIVSNARLLLDAMIELKENEIKNGPAMLGFSLEP